MSSRRGGFFWLLAMSSAISSRCKRGNMVEALEEDDWGQDVSAMLGALFGPGKREEQGCGGRNEGRSEGEWDFEGGTPEKERDSLCIGGGTKRELAGFSGSPGGETEALDIGQDGR